MNLRLHPGHIRTYSLALAFPLLLFPLIAGSSAFDCSTGGRCGLPGDGPYPHLVLGTVVAVADAAEAEVIYRWARGQGYWSGLPEGPSAFVKAIQVVSVEVPQNQGPKPMTLLMGRVHFEAIRIAAGDFVRYIPREPSTASKAYEGGEKDAYRELYGCIALLCRAEDLLCPARYRSGVYRQADGVPLDPHAGTVLKHGTHVDPLTYLPVAAPRK